VFLGPERPRPSFLSLFIQSRRGLILGTSDHVGRCATQHRMALCLWWKGASLCLS
jgi:hypothetical protein